MIELYQNSAAEISLRILACEELAHLLGCTVDWIALDTRNMSNYEFFTMYERLASKYDELKALPL